MDPKNLFCTPATYRALRAEYGAGLVVAVVLALLHLDEIRWPVFVALFLVIDLVGYLPGHLAWRRAHRAAAQQAPGAAAGISVEVPRVCFALYNGAHSLLTAGALAGLWCLVVQPEWALLALPIHLLGDRALFGNLMKPYGVGFEPEPHPAYTRFRSDYEQHGPRLDRDHDDEPGPAERPAAAVAG